MASVCKDGGGTKRVLFVDEQGKRRTIRLGKTTIKQALSFKVKLEDLMTGKTTGSIAPDTARWVADLPDKMHEKLVEFGLVDRRQKSQSVPMGEFVAGYIASRIDLKRSTVLVLRQAEQSLMDYFGPDKPLDEIHEGDAESWRLWMVKQGLAEATIRKRCANAKQFLASARKQKLVSSNPFADLKSSAVSNSERLYFVSRQEIGKVFDACTDCEWRLLFGLARFGGLRTPSESLGLRWADINWSENRMLVRSPKTAHYPNGASRIVPIFAELKPYLIEAFEAAEEGAVYCISRYRQASSNLRTQAHRIIKRAGLKPWPRTFQNLRASRETELTDNFPLKTVTSWLGNSPTIALKHYCSVREEDFERAAQNPAHLAQKAAQSGAVQGSTEQQANPSNAMKNADLLVGTGGYSVVQNMSLAPRGFEPLLPG